VPIEFSLLLKSHLTLLHWAVKINKQTLKMEEVEQFDDISMEDLAEGNRWTTIDFDDSEL
jgi:hypothetical protein